MYAKNFDWLKKCTNLFIRSFEWHNKGKWDPCDDCWKKIFCTYFVIVWGPAKFVKLQNGNNIKYIYIDQKINI